MDNLTATAIAAQRAKMSYGQYVALHGVHKIDKPFVFESFTKVCRECGKEFSVEGKRSHIVFCSDKCGKRNWYKRKKQIYDEEQEAK